MTTKDTSITLRSTDDAMRLAQIAATSGLTAYRRPEAAAVVLLTGHELGLGPMASLRGIYEVSGRPVLAADLMVAVVRASGHCESWRVVESTVERCTITTRRKGEADAESCTWTTEDAKRAGCSGATWQKFPRQMLSHRCAAELARRVYPDVLLGLYTPEEMGAAVSVDGTPAEVIEARPVAPAVTPAATAAALVAMADAITTPASVHALCAQLDAVDATTEGEALLAAAEAAPSKDALDVIAGRVARRKDHLGVETTTALRQVYARRRKALTAAEVDEERAAIVAEAAGGEVAGE